MPEEVKKFAKREPSKFVRIKDLQGANVPSRIAVAGTVVSKNEELYSFVIDDGEGTILVITNDAEQFNKIKEGQFIRVLGKIWGEGEEVEIQADVIQDFTKVDPKLYQKFVATMV